MQDSIRHIVVYRDNSKSRVKLYGPFVSLTMANDFMETLPSPMLGGSKSVKFISPYTHDEASLAAETILRERQGLQPDIDALIKRPNVSERVAQLHSSHF